MRATLLVVTLVGLLASLALIPAAPPIWVVAIWCLVGLVGLLVERYRYKPVEAGPAGPGWIRTGESFIDPETGEPVSVYYEPRTGERRYVRGIGSHPEEQGGLARSGP